MPTQLEKEGVVILFADGDGGGLQITPRGVRKIPPFGPVINEKLNALGTLIRVGSTGTTKKTGGGLTTATDVLTEEVVRDVAGALNTSPRGLGIIVTSTDGDFSCGTVPRRWIGLGKGPKGGPR